jgi:iron complex transport system substrate-binding protein
MTHEKYIRAFALAMFIAVVLPGSSVASGKQWYPAPDITGYEKTLLLPLDMRTLADQLSDCLGHRPADRQYPRQISYRLDIHDFHRREFYTQQKTIDIPRKPVRIIPHSVGIGEILWAICPRERMIAFHEFTADPRFSFISKLVNRNFSLFSSKDTEQIIGHQPDLLLTVFYSGADFKEKLTQASIQYVDLGYFGNLESITYQIRLIGQMIGEEGNAEALIERMTDAGKALQKQLPSGTSKLRILHYGEGGYVTGRNTTFNAVCGLIGCVNVAAENGVTTLSQIDYETLLRWDPDAIILPMEQRVKEKIMSMNILSFSKAVKNRQVFEVPGIYLNASSQFIMATANLIAGLIHGDSGGR